MYAGKERRNRVVALVLAVVLVAGVVLALLATVVQARPAQAAVPAHAALVSVTPADGAQLTSAPTRIELTFDSAVNAEFIQVYLTRDGGQVETGTPSTVGYVVTVPVTGSTGPGAYTLLWQVTGEDGHRVPGESSFWVLGAAGAPVATPQVTPSYKTPQTQPTWSCSSTSTVAERGRTTPTRRTPRTGNEFHEERAPGVASSLAAPLAQWQSK